MSLLVNLFFKRGISTSVVREGKKNFRKFPIYNKRGTRIFKEQQKDPNCNVPIHKRGVRDTGYLGHDGKFVLVPEMVPELMVPDLTGFKLKPYVSYRAPDVVQTEFTSEDLFNVVYAPKISKDFTEGQLDEDGNPKEPSVEEKMTPDEARIKAEQTGTDLFLCS